MGFLSVLTLIFIALKLMSVIDWSWWAVLAPVLIEAVLGITLAFYALRRLW